MYKSVCYMCVNKYTSAFFVVWKSLCLVLSLPCSLWASCAHILLVLSSTNTTIYLFHRTLRPAGVADAFRGAVRERIIVMEVAFSLMHRKFSVSTDCSDERMEINTAAHTIVFVIMSTVDVLETTWHEYLIRTQEI